MGGLEGLINILDSEGGFGALEIQVLVYDIQHLGHHFLFLKHEQNFSLK